MQPLNLLLRPAGGQAGSREGFLLAFPNPSSNGRAYLRHLAGRAGTGRLWLRDGLGRTLRQQPLDVRPGLNEWAVDLSPYGERVVIASIRTEEGDWTERLVVLSRP